MKAPMVYFGGKSKCVDLVWPRFGDVKNYVEPFAGSIAILLGRPEEKPFGTETINDLDGFVANFWRASQADPEAVARHADNPVNECDLHARHLWLVGQRERITEQLCGDPDWYDSKAAGWWVWGINCWIGSGWCSGKGPWQSVGGKMVLGDAGKGVNRKLPHLGNGGTGVNRQLPHLGDGGKGVNRKETHLVELFSELRDRLENVRVCCGDWQRVCGPSVTHKHGLTAVFLDPPYADTAKRADKLYACDSLSVAHEVRKWAIENGSNPLMRICLAGYEGEHEMPSDWETVEWKANGGYGGQSETENVNAAKERLWFSPHCLKIEDRQGLLF